MAGTSLGSWSEIQGDGDYEQPYETEEDTNGVRTVVDYYTDKSGRRVKRTRSIKRTVVTHRVNQAVEARKHWKRFGDCAGKGLGPEPGITLQGDDVVLETIVSKKGEESANAETVSLGVVCRTCGATGDHWTSKCPYKDKLSPDMDDGARSSSGKYQVSVPKPGSEESMQRIRERRDESTLRVINLSDYTTEEDLKELFRPFGPISRVYLVKDRVTQQPRGFAFVTFHERADAARALEKLSGHGYDHLILHLEWSNSSRDQY